MVTGRLKQRSYETKEGEKRTVFEVEVDEIGPSLRYATAKVTRTQRQGGAPAGGGFSPPAGDSINDDPWAAASSTPTGGGWATTTNDEPPF
jgi:single-strand DNA-binding protein